MTSVRIRIPEKLYRELNRLVKQDCFSNYEVVAEIALRKFLNSYRPEIIEEFLQEDVQWALNCQLRKSCS